MSNVVSLQQSKEEIMEVRWRAYLAARDRAERTGQVADGIEMGKSFRRFLDLFLSTDQRDAIGRGEVGRI